MGLFSSDPVSHFPVVNGKRLDGTDVRFPHDLPSDATLLILSFMDDRDPLSDQWARLGERIAEQHPERFSVLEVPVVNAKLKLLGGLATMGIRGQVETDDEHARTVPIYVDPKPFQKKLKVKSKGVYPILVARDGRIAWRGEDAIDMDEIAELEAAVAELLDSPVPDVTGHPDIDPEADEDPEGDGAEPEGDGDEPEGDGDEPEGDGDEPEASEPDGETQDLSPANAPEGDDDAPSLSGPSDDPAPVAS